MNTYIVEFRDKQGYLNKSLFTEATKDILRGKLEERGYQVISLERYA